MGGTGGGLTPREQAVLAAVGRRLNNAEIAAELFVSVRTVESHIAALRRKIGADTRAGLIRAADEERWRPEELAETRIAERRHHARAAASRRDWQTASRHIWRAAGSYRRRHGATRQGGVVAGSDAGVDRALHRGLPCALRQRRPAQRRAYVALARRQHAFGR